MCFTLLAALKLDGEINISWWTVFGPIWCWNGLVIAGALVGSGLGTNINLCCYLLFIWKKKHGVIYEFLRRLTNYWKWVSLTNVDVYSEKPDSKRKKTKCFIVAFIFTGYTLY